MHEDFRNRLCKELERRKVDGYIACTPANLFYTTGFRSLLLDMSQFMMGTDMALIPTDSAKTPALIVSDFMENTARTTVDFEDVRTYRMWVECRNIDIVIGGSKDGKELSRLNRPAQYDSKEIHNLLRDILNERGLGSATIGIDLKTIKAETLLLLKDKNPECTFVDVTDVLYDLRMIKYPQEIEAHRKAVYLFEKGLEYAISNVHEGQSADEIRYDYVKGVFDTVMKNPKIGILEEAWAVISVGTGETKGVSPGDLIKLDNGVNLGGYYSDSGRTFCFSKPDNEQAKVHNVLKTAHERAREMMRPGVRLSDIHKVATESIRSQGLMNFSRGHYGHSVGRDDYIEEPPFISPEEHRLLQPGMVMCLETPYYAHSLGAIQIEDMIVITEDGSENLNTLSHNLVEL